ncbi:MAG TPA: hypothetical protein VHE33_07915 [Acidobacteriaceae bacterium]|nr:hypothetical protein [Acidobacteriaceae bacterium]
MGKINIGRWVVGGLVCGIVLNCLGYLVDGLLLASQWNQNLVRLGRPELNTSQMIWFNLIGFALGLLAVWIYAAIRPRFGAGVGTAAIAGIAVWVAASVLPNASMMWVTGLFNNHLTLYTTLGALVELVVGTIAGAALYREESATVAAAAPPARQTVGAA